MELHQLKCFLETVRSGSMNKASANMYISQPALSIAIRNLEEELNTLLFERKGKKLIITKAGEAIVPYAEKMINYENEIIRVSKNADRETKTVRLMVLAGSALIPGIITAYHSIHPHVDFKVIHEKSTNSEQPDLIIKASVNSNNLLENETKILSEKILVAVPKDHELSRRKELSPKELQKYELIGLNRNLSLRKIEEEYCRREGITLKHSIECDNPSILRDLISRGLGLALVAEKTWLFQFQSSVNLIPLDSPLWARDIIMEKTNFRDNGELLNPFSAFLIKELEKL